jgi:hypothetical protein
MKLRKTLLVTAAAVAFFGTTYAGAQQIGSPVESNRPPIGGVAGSPDGTITIDGRYLPPPPQKFRGLIELNAPQSKPAWPARVAPPKDAPNILLIMNGAALRQSPDAKPREVARPRSFSLVRRPPSERGMKAL